MRNRNKEGGVGHNPQKVWVAILYRGGSGNLKMVRPLTDNGFNGGDLARCDINLYTA